MDEKKPTPLLKRPLGIKLRKNLTFSRGKSMVTESKEVVNSVVEYTKNNYVIAGLILISTNAARGTNMMPIAHALLD